MLKIKEGVKISPYGPLSEITSESEISQDVLNHLKSRYPEEIEGEYEEEEKANGGNRKVASGPKAITKAQLTALVEKVKNDTATPEEREIVAEAKSQGKL